MALMYFLYGNSNLENSVFLAKPSDRTKAFRRVSYLSFERDMQRAVYLSESNESLSGRPCKTPVP